MLQITQDQPTKQIPGRMAVQQLAHGAGSNRQHALHASSLESMLPLTDHVEVLRDAPQLGCGGWEAQERDAGLTTQVMSLCASAAGLHHCLGST